MVIWVCLAVASYVPSTGGGSRLALNIFCFCTAIVLMNGLRLVGFQMHQVLVWVWITVDLGRFCAGARPRQHEVTTFPHAGIR